MVRWVRRLLWRLGWWWGERQSLRDLRRGDYRVFDNAADATAWLLTPEPKKRWRRV